MKSLLACCCFVDPCRTSQVPSRGPIRKECEQGALSDDFRIGTSGPALGPGRKRPRRTIFENCVLLSYAPFGAHSSSRARTPLEPEIAQTLLTEPQAYSQPAE